jgi:CubicO group peptidase (beta-lactamase class C family)
MKKNTKILWLIIVAILATVAVWQYPKLNLISGFAAKNMASTVFLSNRTQESVEHNDHDVPLVRLANSEYETSSRSAFAQVYGLMKRKAVCEEGVGCVLINDEFEKRINFEIPERRYEPSSLPYPYGNGNEIDTLFPNIDYAALSTAFDNTFNDTAKTRTALVLYRGHVIAERYDEGFTKNTRILGWSMTKSVLATLYGIMEYQGKLSINDPVPLPSWQNDERKDITLNHLLRMQSGLAWEEDYSTISDVTRMLFSDSNMAVAQSTKNVVAPPTEIWNYSSGTSNLLSGILRTKFLNYQMYLNYPYKSLIDRIGMHSMLLETDLAGNFVGSSYGWANTRDWGKFGLLYLNKGDWNGTQLFDPSWVSYVSTPTKNSNGTYGAHFWLNAQGKYPDVPRDLYSANGYQGQYVFIIPSKDLVIVRTGLAEEPEFDANNFLSEIIAAIQ